MSTTEEKSEKGNQQSEAEQHVEDDVGDYQDDHRVDFYRALLGLLVEIIHIFWWRFLLSVYDTLKLKGWFSGSCQFSVSDDQECWFHEATNFLFLINGRLFSGDKGLSVTTYGAPHLGATAAAQPPPVVQQPRHPPPPPLIPVYKFET